MNFNKVIVCGRLTRDPEGRETKNGASVCNFSIATNRTWTQDGEKKEETEFHNIVAFGRQGESSAEHLRKGDTVLVEGRIQTRSWEGEDGQTRYRTEVIAERVQFGQRSGDKRGAGEWSDEQLDQKNEDRSPTEPDKAPSKPAGRGFDYPEETIDPEDIPF